MPCIFFPGRVQEERRGRGGAGDFGELSRAAREKLLWHPCDSSRMVLPRPRIGFDFKRAPKCSGSGKVSGRQPGLLRETRAVERMHVDFFNFFRWVLGTVV